MYSFLLGVGLLGLFYGAWNATLVALRARSPEDDSTLAAAARAWVAIVLAMFIFSVLLGDGAEHARGDCPRDAAAVERCR